ncbi:MAG: hypothetical protein A2428_01330 [Bdellovibrionales bacterium RIFOXYC1_FULL_54_43]|nr:MAG: hypothetical protein A2428_01330 [Bdellovibrionales bacterium RIFOXYC1_FULL_54_43]OFZ81268.1 MAG: hypothetical protein A2603_14430 [Bdellovibrionales bacterium RIFOXYD1_FULL_55_31]
MSNSLRVRNFRVAFAIGVLVMACASVPAFHPSVPLENATSLPEALVLCNEYRASIPAKRPVSMLPYVKCVDRVAELFPTRLTRGFLVFKEELHFQYDLLKEADWTPQKGVDLETAIHAVFRALWRNEPRMNSYTVAERQLVMQLFSKTADALNAAQWNVSQAAALDPQLETLRAGFAALSEPPHEKNRAAELSARNSGRTARLCEQILHLKTEIGYLGSLWRDLLDMTDLAPGNETSLQTRERYETRLRLAGSELETLRARVREAESSFGFKVRQCRSFEQNSKRSFEGSFGGRHAG